MRRRLIVVIVVCDLLVLLAVGAVLVARAHQRQAASADPAGATAPAPTSPQFTLHDVQGRLVTQDTFRGRCELVYFGYSFCPDICPTELGFQARLLKALGADADRVVTLFITIDPQRDTPAHLAQYVALFDPRIIGLTGSPAQVHAAASAFGAWYQRATQAPGTPAMAPGQYLIDHTSSTYLVDPAGRLVGTIDSQGRMDDALQAVRSCR